jgi:hypothetical protein
MMFAWGIHGPRGMSGAACGFELGLRLGSGLGSGLELGFELWLFRGIWLEARFRMWIKDKPSFRVYLLSRTSPWCHWKVPVGATRDRADPPPGGGQSVVLSRHGD